MTKQQATWDDLWNLNEEELEELLAADKKLIDLQQETGPHFFIREESRKGLSGPSV